MTTLEAVQLILNSAGLRISAKGFSQLDLVQLAANAKQKNTPLTIVVAGSSLTHADMVQIALNGGGTVTFDFIG
jgi:hypothetical protein